MTQPDLQNIEAELKEKLAAIEHERWASWQKWVFEGCGSFNKDGSFTITKEKADKMLRQISTPYSELSRPEQEADLREVDRYWPLIQQLCSSRELAGRIDELHKFLKACKRGEKSGLKLLYADIKNYHDKRIALLSTIKVPPVMGGETPQPPKTQTGSGNQYIEVKGKQ